MWHECEPVRLDPRRVYDFYGRVTARLPAVASVGGLRSFGIPPASTDEREKGDKMMFNTIFAGD